MPPEAKARPVLRAERATETDGETWRPGIDAGAGAMAGLLPGVAPMLELGGSAARGRWGLFGAARYLPRARTTDDQGLQGYASIVRARFEIGGLGEVYRMPPFSGAAVARVVFSL